MQHVLCTVQENVNLKTFGGCETKILILLIFLIEFSFLKHFLLTGNNTLDFTNRTKILENIPVKGSDRLCKVVELSMQCCGKLLSNSFETY